MEQKTRVTEKSKLQEFLCENRTKIIGLANVVKIFTNSKIDKIIDAIVDTINDNCN